MNHRKAGFFDAQADAPWAAAEYTVEEMEKISWLFDTIGVRPGLSVLEPGCGGGRITRLLAQRVGSAGRVTAFDVSPAMIEQARRRCAHLPGADIQCAALEDLRLDPAAYDLALCFNVFPHFDDQQRALQIIERTLKPGARCAVFHLEPSIVINDLHRKAGTVVAHDMLPSPDQLASMVRAAGFDLISLRDDDRYLALLKKSGNP
jgi:demethylmenaquinone methyltransferase/2-methoxy-6-polyprenyl-1,4-benzoquinol methylase